MMKRISIIFIILAVVTGLASFAVVDMSAQRSLEIPGNSIGEFPVRGDNTQIELSPGLTFHISSTASVSCMTRPTIDWLISKGCVTDSSTKIILGQTNSSEFTFSAKSYKINIPIASYIFTFDSISGRTIPTADNSVPIRYIKGVEIIEADDNSNNTLGIDFIRHFMMEFNMLHNSLSFHSVLPEGYEKLGDFKVGRNPLDLISRSPRFYMQVKIDHSQHDLLINTELDEVPVMLPASKLNDTDNYMLRKARLSDSKGHSYNATVDQSAWIEFGNRAGSNKVYYVEDNGNKSEINPLLFFKQDVLINFIDRSIYLRPYYNLKDLLTYDATYEL